MHFPCRLWPLCMLAACSLASPLQSLGAEESDPSFVNRTICNGNTYTYDSLAGFGSVPANARDKFGDTLGGYGGAIALDTSSWKKLDNGSYTATLWAAPNRGWNTHGKTSHYQSRVHKFTITLTPQPSASIKHPASPNLDISYIDSILFQNPCGVTSSSPASYIRGGFGNKGPQGYGVSLDIEGLVLSNGTFWASDESGPAIYHFSETGDMLSAIAPPDAFVAHGDNGSESSTGRVHNQGFEGLTLSQDGKTLSVLLQSALAQDGGTTDGGQRYVRFLQYDISNPSSPVYAAEYVVSLPLFTNSKGHTEIAAQNEIHALSATQFLVLARDSNKGYGNGKSNTESLYRHIDIFDISSATDINGAYDAAGASVASGNAGVLAEGVTPATYCSFLDFNVNSQLGRFGLHNGGKEDSGLLNEKWESLALAPVHPEACDASFTSGELFLFSFSDNDFTTQDGYMDHGKFKYKDPSGYNIANQALVFRVTLP